MGGEEAKTESIQYEYNESSATHNAQHCYHHAYTMMLYTPPRNHTTTVNIHSRETNHVSRLLLSPAPSHLQQVAVRDARRR